MSVPALAALLSGRLRGIDYPDRPSRQRAPQPRPPTADMTGQRFGRLRVVEPLTQAGRRLRWACLCDCGTWTAVETANLKRTQSCGCLRRERAAKEP